MRSIMIEDRAKIYQFSTLKFNKICDNWVAQDHEGLTAQQYLDKYLHITKHCYYNYRNGRTGMVEENIIAFAKLINIPMEALLEEKTPPLPNVINPTKLSDFSKGKLFELLKAIEACIFAFFVSFESESPEFFDLLDLLRVNECAVPDELFIAVESFVWNELDPLVNDPTSFLASLPLANGTAESLLVRNKAIMEVEDTFRSKFDEVKNALKVYLIAA